jgi:lipid-binding SYLF domain-containing protein
MRRTLTAIFALMASALICGSPAMAGTEEQALVDKAKLTVDEFARSGDMGGFQDYLKRAKAVIVIPQLLKAGFFIGGSGGSGVLLANGDSQGSFSHPSFITMGSGSIGLQFGAEAQQIILVIMTEKGLDAVLRNKVTLGADASVAAGPIGGGGKVAATSSFSDIYSFAVSQGLFAGVSVEGAVLQERREWNQKYYQKEVKASDIVVRRQVLNKGAEALVGALNELSKRP